MADPLYDLLQPHLSLKAQQQSSNPEISKYLSRLVSLRLSDLTTTEPQSLAQSQHSNLVSIQALSSRSHRTTTTSSDHLSTLHSSLPQLISSIESIKKTIPDLDSSAVGFASSYSRPKDETAGESKGTALLSARRNAALLARQADKVQDILELPSLLRASIAAASTAGSGSTTSTSGANYTQALDLFAHIKRLHMLYPESQLVKAVLAEAESAMKDMTTNLITSLRGQNLRLAAAIRMIGWLRRVAPELSTARNTTSSPFTTLPTPITSTSQFDLSSATTSSQAEGHFGALFLVARLYTFLSMTEALAPLRDLADQETQARKENAQNNAHLDTTTTTSRPPHPTRKTSTGHSHQIAGQQTERYLKRYIEIFREQSFATISMFRNIFPANEVTPSTTQPTTTTTNSLPVDLDLSLPSALQSFPLFLVDIFMAVLKQYLPNVTDPTVRESLLMQVLYAANSLGRLGADFSLMIAELDEDDEETEDIPTVRKSVEKENIVEGNEAEDPGTSAGVKVEEGSPEAKPPPEPEWITVMKKHRVQAARLEALAAGQDRAVQRQSSVDVAVR